MEELSILARVLDCFWFSASDSRLQLLSHCASSRTSFLSNFSNLSSSAVSTLSTNSMYWLISRATSLFCFCSGGRSRDVEFEPLQKV